MCSGPLAVGVAPPTKVVTELRQRSTGVLVLRSVVLGALPQMEDRLCPAAV